MIYGPTDYFVKQGRYSLKSSWYVYPTDCSITVYQFLLHAFKQAFLCPMQPFFSISIPSVKLVAEDTRN